MAKKQVKHHKFRNIGIIYEMLLSKVSSEIISSKNNTPAMKILNKYFCQENAIKEEFRLYHILKTNKVKSEEEAKTLIEEVVNARSNINNKDLKKQKYSLVKDIINNYDKEIFNTKINEYKLMASIYKILESNDVKNTNPLPVFKSKIFIIENLLNKNNVKSVEVDKEIKLFTEQDKSIRYLTYKIMVENFNKTYGKLLNEKQKNLVGNYISNLSSSPKFKKFINNEITTCKNNIKENLNKIDDKTLKIKLESLYNDIDVVKSKNIKDSIINILMDLYEIEEEIKGL